MKRREFLAATGAALVTPNLSWARAPMQLTAETVLAQILPPDDPKTAMLGFNGNTPGPEIRVRRGAQVQVQFNNRINQGSAVHWHGIRSDNAMDGVPGLTQDVVAAGDSFAYDFAAPDAGTYWYHSHNRSWEQVARGLYGPLIVEEDNPPDVDHDVTVLIDDWRLSEDGEQAGGYDGMHDQAHGGRLGNYARAIIENAPIVRQGDRIRLRLINVATARIFPIEVKGGTGKIVALDGMPLAHPQELGSLTLAPAQRVDLIVNVTSEENITFNFMTDAEPYLLGEITTDGTNPTPRSSAIAPLEANAILPPDLDSAIVLDLVMEGGAMSMRMMSGGIWAFNGQSGLTDTPFHQFQRGETARITLRNDTRFPHGIHLHGHHFHEVDEGDTLGPLRDTTLVEVGMSRDIICVFDNPGKWLLHCHMLGHQAAGMKTWVEVI